jgi:site-specific recombinase XerD
MTDQKRRQQKVIDAVPPTSVPAVWSNVPSTNTRYDDFDELIDNWVQSKYTLLSKSKRTLETYQNYGKRFRQFLLDRNHDLADPYDEICPLIEEWITMSHAWYSQTVSGTTRNHRIAILTSLYNHGIKKGILEINPLIRIDKSKKPKTPPNKAKPLETDFIKDKLKDLNVNNPMDLRDMAIICVATGTGKRATEITNLLLNDISPTAGGLMIRWRRLKGGEAAETLLSGAAATILMAHIVLQEGENWLHAPPDTPLWRSFSMNQTQSKRITYSGLKRIFKRRLGISKIHTTRHTYAVTLEDMGTPLREIQKLLGHTSLATTEKYLRELQTVNTRSDKISGMIVDDAILSQFANINTKTISTKTTSGERPGKGRPKKQQNNQ